MFEEIADQIGQINFGTGTKKIVAGPVFGDGNGQHKKIFLLNPFENGEWKIGTLWVGTISRKGNEHWHINQRRDGSETTRQIMQKAIEHFS